MPDDLKPNESDVIYQKHQNIIDGIYTVRHPDDWDEIPLMEQVDAEDEDGELYALFRDVKIIDAEDIKGLKKPGDKIDVKDYIFILRREGKYYICETQGLQYIKFASEISNVDFIKLYDRQDKIIKLYGKDNLNPSGKPLL